MLSRRIARLTQTPPSAAARLAAVRLYHPGDQARDAGAAATAPRNGSPLDAASPEKGKRAPHGHLGNREGLGFAEQVGSQSATARHFAAGAQTADGATGKEDITPPSFVDAVKSKLGFETTAAEDKQNRGGGAGVTGTGRFADKGRRAIHTPAAASADKTKGQAPEASREPKQATNADQNDHLKHKSASSPDSGKGNAAAEPTLPSKQAKTSQKTTAYQRRRFSTSSWVAAQSHSSETYFKEADNYQPANPKVHQVDSSTDGAPVARANEKVGTGDFSTKGPGDPEYQTMSKHDQPYDVPPTRGSEKDKKLRYGAGPGVMNEPPSQPDEGPAGKDAGGRKPEGRS